MRTTTSLSRTEIEELWDKNHDVVYRICHSWHRTCGVDIEELCSVGRAAFMKAVMSYDTSRAAFTTWVHHNVTLAMRHHIRREIRKGFPVDPQNIPDHGQQDSSLRSSWIAEWVGSLPSEVAFVFRLVINAPEEGLELIGSESRHKAKTVLRRRLRRLGWHDKEIDHAFRAAKIAARELA